MYEYVVHTTTENYTRRHRLPLGEDFFPQLQCDVICADCSHRLNHPHQKKTLHNNSNQQTAGRLRKIIEGAGRERRKREMLTKMAPNERSETSLGTPKPRGAEPAMSKGRVNGDRITFRGSSSRSMATCPYRDCRTLILTSTNCFTCCTSRSVPFVIFFYPPPCRWSGRRRG